MENIKKINEKIKIVDDYINSSEQLSNNNVVLIDSMVTQL